MSSRSLSQVLLVAATVAAVAGGVFLLVRESSPGGMEILLPTATAAPLPVLKVYVSGAVRSPGVYTVRDGDRLSDVIAVAGGARRDADLTAVNLAARIRDEDHWHIPTVGEIAEGISAQPPGRSETIDLNTADVALLTTLPGIGEVKANAIVRYREAIRELVTFR